MTRAAAIALVAALALAGCTDQSRPSPVAGRDAAEPKPPATCPLTGRKPPPGTTSRPAVAVKIENSEAARPQSGLEKADLVFEEIVEGGITRFLAIYHCGQTKKVGPVRSARFDDPKIALPFTKVLAYSGANAIVERELKRNGMIRFDELSGGDAFFRDPPGTLDTHSLFADVAKLRTLVPRARRKTPAPDLFEFGPLDTQGRRARVLTVHFTASNAIEYRWKGGLWQRWEGGERFMSNGGEQIAVPNVLVQLVEVDNSNKIVDPAGNPSPDIALQGRGKALLLRDGRVFAGTWRVRRAGRPAVFQTRGGDPFVFARGSIWVELVPSSKGEVKGSVRVR